jgi:hypothetical protein
MLKAFIPASALSNPGASCKEKGKSISFRKEAGDIVHCLDLKEAIKTWNDWPQGAASCDCVFICGQEGRGTFLVLLAELKGDDTQRAMEQILRTAEVFCKKSPSGFAGGGHGMAKKSPFSPGNRSVNHGKIVLAAIACRSGGRVGSGWQDEQKRLRNNKIKLLDRQPANKVFTVSELFKEADWK